MKTLKAIILLCVIALVSTSCFKDNDDSPITTLDINDFVWKGMNSWYFWQTEVSNLSDSKDDNFSEYQAYLNQYSNPEELFNSLRFQYGTTDRFSWFIEDYIQQELEFQGVTKSHGMKYQPVQINNNGDIIIYVRYVADNSPASAAFIKRGDIINAINGTAINTSNYNNIISSIYDDTVTLSFVSENAGTLTPTESKTIMATVLSENPIYLKKIFNNINNKKVGYLVYNAFRSSYNDELNDAFSYFKNENIDELILDLRLNGGGSVATSAYLASMIYSDAGVDRFANLKFNNKHSAEDGFYNFENTLNVFNTNSEKIGEQTINRLTTLNRLYVLTSSSTASASEMVINGLKPYMNSIKLVGTTTYGKNVGSITLYDSPKSDYQNKASANPNHNYAMQPIVFQIFNKNGESDYTQGFSPDIEVKEYEYWNSILPFGDENEVVLKAALDNIKGLTGKVIPSKKQPEFAKKLDFTIPNQKFETEMYIEKDYFEKE